MYLEFFGLAQSPFNNTPDPAFFFEAKTHREALASMIYGIEQGKGFIMVSGDVGTGKTLLIQTLKRELDSKHIVISITNPWCSPEDVLAAIRNSVELAEPDNNALNDALKRRLVELNEQGRRVILVIDEAHQMSAQMMEGVRLLSNIETETEKLLQIVFVGQDELSEIMARYSMRQIQQRLFISHRLEPMTQEETIGYIRRRIQIAGGTPLLFPQECMEAIFNESKGTPRLINFLCDNCLLLAFARELPQVSREIVDEAIANLRRVQRVSWPEPDTRPEASLPAAAGKTSTVSIIAPTASPAESTVAVLAPVVEAKPANPAPVQNPAAKNDNGGAMASSYVAAIMQAEGKSSLPFRLPFGGEAGAADAVKPSVVEVPSVQPPSSPKGPGLTLLGKILAGVGLAVFGAAAAIALQKWFVNSPSAQVREEIPARTVQAPEPAVTKRGADYDGVRAKGMAAPESHPEVSTGVGASRATPVLSLPLGLLASDNLQEVVVPRSGGVKEMASGQFKVWNDSVRDLILAANPAVGARLDELAAGTRLKLPRLTRDRLFAQDASGRYYIYYGSFDRVEEANSELAALRRIWPDSLFVSGGRADGTTNRVFVGGFSNQNEARSALDSLWFKHLPSLN